MDVKLLCVRMLMPWWSSQGSWTLLSSPFALFIPSTMEGLIGKQRGAESSGVNFLFLIRLSGEFRLFGAQCSPSPKCLEGSSSSLLPPNNPPRLFPNQP
ncbi:hypothetical protein BO86DRAFT_95848 [Aspergillus japonicus CBS 114.51]|uniref:Uncharacterized protein n=1 Tax=Aspergillus japonicus CBS 114.51 TaxID=1448312 RepID=A0A8T8X0J9_ASPJA|nr:hypothetical protein BO86DRAFT_95848 [Aspergillus japonicus CBS 114.51]RAH81657.1 hypothetical protein BO86DRAFT_95848 [Aspergillus japonicus CBS 114.51]